MMATMNELFTGEYKHDGEAIIYGDSVDGRSIIDTNIGKMTIERLFHAGDIKWSRDDKEYTVSDKIKVKSYNVKDNNDYDSQVKYITRHKVKKTRWKITDIDGNEVIITGDHSIMVERNGAIIEVKPSEIDIKTDLLIVNDK